MKVHRFVAPVVAVCFLVLSGFVTGQYTLNSLKLVARENGYVKLGFGPPVQRGDYSALWVAQDGAAPHTNWGEQANKPDETGTYGGAVRHVNIVTGYPSGEILDSHRNLAEFWDDL